MIAPEPFYAWHEHFCVELGGAQALFTTRRGGVSVGPYESLNLGRFTEDSPEALERNRSLLEHKVGRQLTFVHQVHGAHVRVGSAPVTGARLEEADGQVVAEGGLAPVALAADCLPIALGSETGAGIVHAGWRGLAGGVIAQGVKALRAVAGEGPIAAAIGPGAGPCCYEVGEEVHAQFAADAAIARRGDNLDLKALARRQLAAAGVKTVHDISMCTICTPSLFFSHRRDQGVTGRHAGVIWLS